MTIHPVVRYQDQRDLESWKSSVSSNKCQWRLVGLRQLCNRFDRRCTVATLLVTRTILVSLQLLYNAVGIHWCRWSRVSVTSSSETWLPPQEHLGSKPFTTTSSLTLQLRRNSYVIFRNHTNYHTFFYLLSVSIFWVRAFRCTEFQGVFLEWLARERERERERYWLTAVIRPWYTLRPEGKQ